MNFTDGNQVPNVKIFETPNTKVQVSGVGISVTIDSISGDIVTGE
jgi:hypothetical protein